MTAQVKTLTAEQANLALRVTYNRLCVEAKVPESLRAIASGANEVIDRATHRAVSVASLRRLKRGSVHTFDCPASKEVNGVCICDLTAALAEIEEKLRDA